MWEKELAAALAAGTKAREAILNIYHSHFDVEIKSDNSPVTLADKAADAIIRADLSKAFPGYAFLTEESEDDLSRLKNDYVWIIDPLDGTKDFVARDDEFTINIALSYKHEAILGVVIIPVSGDVYYAVKGQGAFHLKDGKAVKIHANEKLTGLLVLTSVFHFNDKEKAVIDKYPLRIAKHQSCGSSIKACRIAEGLAEISFRFSDGTKEWDTAACQIIIEEAGGVFVKPDLTRIRYNREDVYNREGYIIANRIENVLL